MRKYFPNFSVFWLLKHLFFKYNFQNLIIIDEKLIARGVKLFLGRKKMNKNVRRKSNSPKFLFFFWMMGSLFLGAYKHNFLLFFHQ